MSSSDGWKKHTRNVQEDRCLICGDTVRDGTGSWDHFVPASMRASGALEVGLAFWTHQRCNSARGSSLPDEGMIKRAVETIEKMDPHYQWEARLSLQIALREHRCYVITLDSMVRLMPEVIK